ncbi:MAG: hypothetical protein LBQ14_01755 [Treponema sp.]|jgi:hypothetical protein|nr:hypothetical protein [Treponema sp.]
MKYFEYLVHSHDSIREIRQNNQGRRVEYGGLDELGRQGWELVTAQPGGKWIFKREVAEGPKLEQGGFAKPAPADYDRGR